MKSLVLALSLFVAVSAQAREEDREQTSHPIAFASYEQMAIDKFNNSQEVSTALELAAQRGFSNQNEEAKAVKLSGQCGFAGCSSTVLVVKTIYTGAVNTSTANVSAIVQMPAVGQSSLEVVNTRNLLNQN
jgi:hypothetical protein